MRNNINSLYLIISISIIVSVHTQLSFAMEKEEVSYIKRITGYSYNVMNGLADVVDDMHGIDLYKPVVEQFNPPFFPILSDECVMYIFVYLYKDKDKFTNLRAIALTCAHGYQLMQDSYFGRLIEPDLRSILFSHLPQEYVDVLVQGKEKQGLKMGDIHLRQLFAFQQEENKRLSEMLLSSNRGRWPQSESILIGRVSRAAKNKWLYKLSTLLRWELGDYKAEEEGYVQSIRKSALKRYFFQEEILDAINAEIVEHSIKFIDITNRMSQIRFPRSLTRLSLKGVENIRTWLDAHNGQIDHVSLDLSHNNLRWIPDELFTIKKVIKLNLNNNLLCYLPESIAQFKDQLVGLDIGNYEAFHPLFTNRIGCHTTGNIFRKVPTVILKLSKLNHLDLKSIQLEELSEAEIIQGLPELKLVNVANNNLPTVPIEDPQNIQGNMIFVDSYGNPGSTPIPLWQRIGDRVYDISFKCVDLSVFILQCMVSHPVAFP